MTRATSLHDLITNIQDQHAKSELYEGQPYVGLFYMVNGVLHWEGLTVRQGLDSAHFKIYPKMHPSYWKELQRKNSSLKPLDAYYFPRGRVVYDTKIRKYELVADSHILSNRKMVLTIKSEFNLPPNNTNESTDIHYSCYLCKGD